jgi:hypothetical protein
MRFLPSDDDDDLLKPKSDERLLDPALAERIKALGLPDWPGLTPRQEYERIRGSKNLKSFMLSLLVPAASIPVIWYLYRGPLQSLTCSFLYDRNLLKLWPINPNYLVSFSHSDYSTEERCFFFAMTSTMSVVWSIWLLWRIAWELCRRDTFYIPRLLPRMTAFAVALIAASYYSYFRIEPSRYGQSLADPLWVGAIKTIVISISFGYFAVALLIWQILQYFRRDKTIPPWPF